MKKVISVFMLTAITAAPAFAAASSSHPPHPGHAPISGEAPGHSKGTMKYRGRPVDPSILDHHSPTGLNLQRVANISANIRTHVPGFDGKIELDTANALEYSIRNIPNNRSHGIDSTKQLEEVHVITGIPMEKLKLLETIDMPVPFEKLARLKEQENILKGRLLNCMNEKRDCQQLTKAISILGKDIRNQSSGSYITPGHGVAHPAHH